MSYPYGLPVLVTHRKRGRVAASLGYIVAEGPAFVVVASTMDGAVPMGLIAIAHADVLDVAEVKGGA